MPLSRFIMRAASILILIVLLSAVGIHNTVNGFPSPTQVTQRPGHYQEHDFAGVGPSNESHLTARTWPLYSVLKREEGDAHMKSDIGLVNSDSDEDFRQFMDSSNSTVPPRYSRPASREEMRNIIVKTVDYVREQYLQTLHRLFSLWKLKANKLRQLRHEQYAEIL